MQNPSKDPVIEQYQLILQHSEDPKMENYAKLCNEHGARPTKTDIEWLKKEAKLDYEEDKPLNIPVFWIMQHYPWFMRRCERGVRLFVGFLKSIAGECELWVGWNSTDTGPALQFFSNLEIDGYDFPITREMRKYITWFEPLEIVFGLERLYKHNPNMVDVHQDIYLLAVAKVLARFPGLVMECHETDDLKVVQANGRKWAKFPFDIREANTADNPYTDFIKLLNSQSAKGAYKPVTYQQQPKLPPSYPPKSQVVLSKGNMLLKAQNTAMARDADVKKES